MPFLTKKSYYSTVHNKYFINLDILSSCAKRVGQLCKKAGVVLTNIDATFPYENNLQVYNIRITPSYPPIDELSKTANLLCICVQIAAIEKLLNLKDNHISIVFTNYYYLFFP
ncbi:hypothetical protein [Thomasclavelia cocleata]|uniref:hypothetical protein n=1 Tax=Thomasclavelia cocleata TaxID=69824 RepID=UPI0015D5C1D7|nr:hypothetical protein [Thomasclavelia cocleata]MCR1959770.1 hypothetical protein [Thomasclavelia cocleata]